MLPKIAALDLFGEPIIEAEVKTNDQGKKKRGTPQAKGYAGRPGGGPAGHFCRDCQHKENAGGGNGGFLKCALIKWRWTHGPGTDIKAKSPACHLWAPIEKKK